MCFVHLFNYTVPCLKWLVTGLARRKHGFDTMLVNIQFFFVKLALEQVYLQEIRPHYYYSNTILSFPYLERRPFVMKVHRVKG
jgi:hypothetical protein